MTVNVNEDRYDRILSLLASKKSDNANHLMRELRKIDGFKSIKYDTVRDYLEKFEEDGLCYHEDIGRTRYYTIYPDWKSRLSIARSDKPVGQIGIHNDAYARTSCEGENHRGKTGTERICEVGFVCHPSVRGNEVSREFIRSHVNGEYQVQIVKVGSMKSVEWLDNSIQVKWKGSSLNCNHQATGSIRNLMGDPEPFSVRTVSNKDGVFSKLSVKVHPRYIYYKDEQTTSQREFIQQVRDICNVLTRLGWEFGEDVYFKGQIHRAIVDPVSPTHVPSGYVQHESDALHYDHSHGTPECEIYGDNPSDVEIMVNLPTIIRSQTDAILELQKQITILCEMQSQTISMSVKPNIFANEGGMYG